DALVGEARLQAGGQTGVSSLWSLGPSLTLPLFDGGARRARDQAALAAVDEAAAALQGKWQTAVAEVEEARARLAAAGDSALAAVAEAAAALQGKWQTAVAEVEEALARLAAAGDRRREAETVAREWQGIARRAVLQARAGQHSGPQRAAAQRNALAAHDDLLTARASQAQAWIRLYRSLGGGWSLNPNEQRVVQP